MRTLPIVLAGLLSLLPSGDAHACRCVRGVIERLYQAPGAARTAVLLRSGQQGAGNPAVPSASPGWVDVETHPLRGQGFQRYRWRGTSCDLRVPTKGWHLLLTQGDPERGLSLCDSVLVPLDEAGGLLAQLLPDPAWTGCRAAAECAESASPGCLPRLPARRDAVARVRRWRSEVTQALHCGDAAAPAGAAPLRPDCQAGSCVLIPPSGP